VLGDSNGDGCPGLCGVDDDNDGDIDEGDINDDDEDGAVDEDSKGFEVNSQGITLRIVSENFTIIAIDREPDLEIDSLVFNATIALNPNQNPATLRSSTTLNRLQGLAGQSLTLTVTRGMITWFASTAFGRDTTTANDLDWVGSSMGLFLQDESFGPVTLSTVMDFSPAGMSEFEMSLDFAF
jgi:hypothetical protein